MEVNKQAEKRKKEEEEEKAQMKVFQRKYFFLSFSFDFTEACFCLLSLECNTSGGRRNNVFSSVIDLFQTT